MNSPTGGGDGIAETGDAVWLHLVGNPINHSTASPLGLHEPVDRMKPRTRSYVSRRYRWRPLPSPQPRRPIEAVGVGHNEQSLACVWGAHGARG